MDISTHHTVIIIPGLGDGVALMELATRHWRTRGLNTLVYSVGWRDDERSFTPKLTRLLELIDTLHESDKRVSLVGTSAGGSAVLNAFIERQDAVHRVINVCGRLRVGPTKGLWAFDAKTKSSPAFADSVTMCETHQNTMQENSLKRVMTVVPLFDEIVPKETVGLQGAHNRIFPSIGHVTSIALLMTLFSSQLTTFLDED